MKTNIRKSLFTAYLIFLVMLAFAMPATAQVRPLNTGNALSNVVTIGATITSSNLAATLPSPITLVNGKGISFTPYYAGAQSTNTGTIGFMFAVSTDGTNYTTTTPIVATSTGNGAAAVRDYTWVPPSTLGAARYIKLLKVTNSVTMQGTCTITNVYWAIEN